MSETDHRIEQKTAALACMEKIYPITGPRVQLEAQAEVGDRTASQVILRSTSLKSSW